CQEYNSLPLTF
nr:immunoglobulin light chain junction region [Macaca mulatta]MOV63438.1 immunoglobulin light chain junction region [Macaca mulatta]MOV64188.1 immunoglobulin light chain junction region [Macaca mulatta]MOV65496.1 immunoglobulin light chain junction region [Macaca mulatta]